MKRDPESVIVCEGYHDRAFLAGLLVARGCESRKGKSYRGEKELKGGGQFGFRTPGLGWLRIVPVDGDDNLLPSAETLLEERMTSPLTRLIVARDDDGPADQDVRGVPAPSPRRTALDNWASRIGARPDGDDFVLNGGAIPTRLSFLVWRAPEPASHLLPPQQTLERLVCAAIGAVSEPRCAAVSRWIETRPDLPAKEKLHKTHAASHMAGWFSDRGYEGLFGAVWDDEAIRDALLARLAATSCLRVLDDLLA